MENQDKLYWLDSIRFIAATLVVITHLRGFVFLEYGALDESSRNVLTVLFFGVGRLGQEAVIAFFVLSGFLVGGFSFQRADNNKVSAATFFVNRATRLMIPLIPAVAFAIVVGIIIDGGFDPQASLGALLFLQGIVTAPLSYIEPLWTLAYEFWFYVLVTSILFLKNGDRKIIGIFIGLLSLFALYQLDISLVIALGFGVIGYYGSKKKCSIKILITGSILLFFSVLFNQSIRASDSITIFSLLSNLSNLQSVANLFLAISFTLVISQVAYYKPGRYAINIENYGTNLSKFSYTVYLVHTPLLHLTSWLGLGRSKSIDTESLIIFIFLFAIVYLVSYVIYLMFEKHTNIVKSNINLSLSKASLSNKV